MRITVLARELVPIDAAKPLHRRYSGRSVLLRYSTAATEGAATENTLLLYCSDSGESKYDGGTYYTLLIRPSIWLL